MSVIDTLRALAITVRNEKKKEANSAIRIGDLFLAIIDFLKGLASGQIRQEGVDTYNDTSGGKTSLLNSYPNPQTGWTVLVRNDETDGGKASLYQWNGTKWINLETSVYQDDLATKEEVQILDDATKAAQESLFEISNNQYLFAFVTANGRVVLACTKEGKIVTPKGIPDEVAASLVTKISVSDILQELKESEYPVSGAAVSKVIKTLETIYPYVVLDAESKMIEWTDKSAKKHFPKQQLIDVIDSRQFDYAIMYASGHIPFHIKNGKVYANMPVLNQAVKDIDNLKSGIGGIRLIPLFGDSLTANQTYSTIFQSLLGDKYKVVNCGVGGENVPAIAARQGGVPTFITESFVLPADTSKIEISSVANPRLKNLLHDAETRLLRQGQGNSVNPCYIQGVECTLSITQTSSTSTDAVWYINRNNAASGTITIQANTPIFMYGAKAYRNPFAIVIWIGQNGGFSSNDELVDYYKRMIEFSGTSNYVLIGLHTGTAASRATLEDVMTKAFGLNFLNWRKYISSLDAFRDAGIEPTQEDLDAISVGSLPPAFWSSSTDSTHLNTLGNTLLPNYVYRHFPMLGFI